MSTNQTEGLQSTYILKSKLKIPKIFHVVREHFMSYKTRNTPFNIAHDLIITWTAASVCGSLIQCHCYHLVRRQPNIKLNVAQLYEHRNNCCRDSIYVMPFDNRSRTKGLRDEGRRKYIEINESPIVVLFSESRLKMYHTD